MDDYVDVAERIRQFNERYPDGSLQNWIEPHVIEVGDKLFIVYAAAAYRTQDDARPGIGYAWEPVPGPTPFTRDSELMNAETSAWGRAIVALGFETKKIASANEVRNRQGSSERDEARTTAAGDGSKSAASDQGQTAHGDGGALPVDHGDVSRSEGSSEFQPPATEKPVTKGVLDELATVLKLLNSSFPEHPGPNRTWADVAKGHTRDRFQKQSSKDLTLAEARELITWLEDQYTQAAKEEAVPFS